MDPRIRIRIHPKNVMDLQHCKQHTTCKPASILLPDSVVDPHHFDADSDSTYHPDADPDPYFQIKAQSPDPAYHFDVDPNADPDPQHCFQTLPAHIIHAIIM
jgi:hypothetical protein